MEQPDLDQLLLQIDAGVKQMSEEGCIGTIISKAYARFDYLESEDANRQVIDRFIQRAKEAKISRQITTRQMYKIFAANFENKFRKPYDEQDRFLYETPDNLPPSDLPLGK